MKELVALDLSINEIIDESFTAPLETPPDITSLPYLVATPVGTCHAGCWVIQLTMKIGLKYRQNDGCKFCPGFNRHTKQAVIKLPQQSNPFMKTTNLNNLITSQAIRRYVINDF